jgi:hypothetical protein
MPSSFNFFTMSRITAHVRRGQILGQGVQFNQDIQLSRPDPLPAARSDYWLNIAQHQLIAPSIVLIAAAHFALFGYFFRLTTISSPISDMFAYIGDYLRFRAGETSLLQYLWQAHDEHHQVWIRLLTWADVEIFHTRGIPFMVAASAAITAIVFLIWRQLRRAEPRLFRPTYLGLLVPMIFLSAANVTDCSVPINTIYPLTVFFVVLALVLFTGATTHYGRGAALFASVGASMATAAGLLAWPILLWVGWREHLGKGWLITLAGFGGAYILFYAHGLNFVGLTPVINNGAASFVSAAHLAKLAHYFVAFMGLPFTREPRFEFIGSLIGGISFLAGLSAVLIATFSNHLSARLDRIAIGLILLALGAAVLAAVGRGDLIGEVKIPIRYEMFVSGLQAGLLCLILPRAVRRFETPRARSFLCLAGLGLAAMLLLLQVFIGRSAAQIATAISGDADCFAEHAQVGTVNPIVTKSPDDSEKVIAALRQLGLLAPRLRNCPTHSQSIVEPLMERVSRWERSSFSDLYI